MHTKRDKMRPRRPKKNLKGLTRSIRVYLERTALLHKNHRAQQTWPVVFTTQNDLLEN